MNTEEKNTTEKRDAYFQNAAAVAEMIRVLEKLGALNALDEITRQNIAPTLAAYEHAANAYLSQYTVETNETLRNDEARAPRLPRRG